MRFVEEGVERQYYVLMFRFGKQLSASMLLGKSVAPVVDHVLGQQQNFVFNIPLGS